MYPSSTTAGCPSGQWERTVIRRLSLRRFESFTRHHRATVPRDGPSSCTALPFFRDAHQAVGGTGRRTSGWPRHAGTRRPRRCLWTGTGEPSSSTRRGTPTSSRPSREDLAALGVRCVIGLADTRALRPRAVASEARRGAEMALPRRPGETGLGTATRRWPLEPTASEPGPHRDSGSARSLFPARHCPGPGSPTAYVSHEAHAPGAPGRPRRASGVLVCGDMLSDVDCPMPAEEDTTLETYMAGLERLREAVRDGPPAGPGPRHAHGSTMGSVRRRHALPRRPARGPSIGRSADPHLDNARLHDANLHRAEGVPGAHGPADGCCWVMQWMPPPRANSGRASTSTISRPG